MDERRGRERRESELRTNGASDSDRLTQEKRRSKENVPFEEQQQKEAASDDPTTEPSGFMRIIRKVGYSVWLIVMVIGAALAFVAAIFLI